MIETIKVILKIFNDNLGIITLFVGIIAIYLYLKQKSDRKRSAARLILQEIRYAEQQIRNSGRGARGYALSSKLLPTNSWNDNVHLFAKHLKETQIDMISEFYSKTIYIDSLIAERSRQKVNPFVVVSPSSSTPLPPASVTAQPTSPGVASPQIHQQQAGQIIQAPNPGEAVTIKLLTDVSLSVEFLYNTPAVEKLTKISEKKWYQLF